MGKDKDINKIINNFRDYNQRQPYWDTIYVNELLEEDHPARILDLVVERLDLTAIYMDYSNEGNPPYHPKMMLKILFYGYYTGSFSCREIWDAVKYRADFVFLAAGAVPNFRTINTFRLRHLDKLGDIFCQIVFLCVQLDLIDFEHLAIDGEKIHANANYKKNRDLEGIKKEYEKTKRGLKKLLKKDPSQDFPESIKAERVKKVQQKLCKLKAMKETLEVFVKNEIKDREEFKEKTGKKKKQTKQSYKIKAKHN